MRLCGFVGYGGVVAFAAPYAAVFFLSVYAFAMNESERGLVWGMLGKFGIRRGAAK